MADSNGADRTVSFVDFDIASLSLSEVEDLEEYSGLTIGKFSEALRAGNDVPARVVTALTWVAGRRADPTFTLADARATKLNGLIFRDAEPKPDMGTVPNADAAGGKPRRPSAAPGS